MCVSHHERSIHRDRMDSTDPPLRGDLRVSTAERDAVVEQLRRHTADGRLTLDEFADRVDEALAATTGNQLQATLRELPVLPADRPLRPARWRAASVISTAVVAALAVLAVATGHPFALFGLGWLWLRVGHRQRWRRGHRGLAFAPQAGALWATRPR